MKYIQNFTYAMFLLYYCIPHSAAGYFFMSLYILLASLGLSIYHIKEKAYIEGTPFYCFFLWFIFLYARDLL